MKLAKQKCNLFVQPMAKVDHSSDAVVDAHQGYAVRGGSCINDDCNDRLTCRCRFMVDGAVWLQRRC